MFSFFDQGLALPLSPTRLRDPLFLPQSQTLNPQPQTRLLGVANARKRHWRQRRLCRSARTRNPEPGTLNPEPRPRMCHCELRRLRAAA